MFLLRELPSGAHLADMQERYPALEPSAVRAFLTMLQTGSDLLTRLDRYLQQHGLLQGRWLVLVMLARREPHEACPSELAHDLGVTGATMTGLLDGLEREALVARRPMPEDRRKTHVRLTAAGVKRLDALMPDYYERVAELFADIPESQRTTLVRLCRTLQDASARVF